MPGCDVRGDRECAPGAIREALADRRARLTPRQVEALGWIARGDSNGEAAARMGVEERSIKFHVAGAMERLGARSRTHAVVLALARGELKLLDR